MAIANSLVADLATLGAPTGVVNDVRSALAFSGNVAPERGIAYVTQLAVLTFLVRCTSTVASEEHEVLRGKRGIVGSGAAVREWAATVGVALAWRRDWEHRGSGDSDDFAASAERRTRALARIAAVASQLLDSNLEPAPPTHSYGAVAARLLEDPTLNVIMREAPAVVPPPRRRDRSKARATQPAAAVGEASGGELRAAREEIRARLTVRRDGLANALRSDAALGRGDRVYDEWSVLDRALAAEDVGGGKGEASRDDPGSGDADADAARLAGLERCATAAQSLRAAAAAPWLRQASAATRAGDDVGVLARNALAGAERAARSIDALDAVAYAADAWRRNADSGEESRSSQLHLAARVRAIDAETRRLHAYAAELERSAARFKSIQ